MRTLEEIKDEIAAELGQKNWSNLLHNYGSVGDSLVNLVAKRYAVEVSKESLVNAANNGLIRLDYNYLHKDCGRSEKRFKGRSAAYYEVDRLSIISESNIPLI